MKLLPRFCVFLCLTVTAFLPAWADHPLAIITLKSRPANQVVPLIKPFVGPNGTITGMNDKLLVRSSPERLQEIRKILAQLDRPPRRLLIHVANDRLSRRDRDRVSAAASIALGNSATVDIGRQGPGKDRFSASVQSTRSLDKLAVTQSVQAIEGQPTFIATGTAIPVPIRQGIISGGVVHYGRGIEYRGATSGFYVLPRVNGDLVTLEVSIHRETPGRTLYTLDVESLRSTVSGKMGEWLDIGQIGVQGQTSDSGILHLGKSSAHHEQRTLLRVEETH